MEYEDIVKTLNEYKNAGVTPTYTSGGTSGWGVDWPHYIGDPWYPNTAPPTPAKLPEPNIDWSELEKILKQQIALPDVAKIAEEIREHLNKCDDKYKERFGEHLTKELLVLALIHYLWSTYPDLMKEVYSKHTTKEE